MNGEDYNKLGARLNRLRLGEACVLSLNHAAKLLPKADAVAREWLRTSGVVQTLEGSEIVIWGDVLTAIRQPRLLASDEPTTTPWAALPKADL